MAEIVKRSFQKETLFLITVYEDFTYFNNWKQCRAVENTSP